MSEVPAKYRVKQGKIIFHGGEKFEEGAELELVQQVAEVHASNIELIISSPVDVKDAPVEDATVFEPEPEQPKRKSKSKLNTDNLTDNPDATNGEP
jgi:hypothetical protein